MRTNGSGRRHRQRRECQSQNIDQWVFNLPDAFLMPLDITRVTRIDPEATEQAQLAARMRGVTEQQIAAIRSFKKVMTVGDPPIHSFKVGDTMHAFDEQITAQVQAASPDRFVGQKIDGTVRFSVYRRNALLCMHECTQAEFATFLQSGQLQRIDLDVHRILRGQDR